MAKFGPLVEQWRAVLDERRGDIPIEFLLSWLAHESGGNPCSTGFVGPVKFEAGIGQQFFGSPNATTFGGVTLPQLRVGCSGQTLTRALTDDEKEPHLVAFLGEVENNRSKANQQLDAAGINWPEEAEDFWMAVKLVHALPCIPLSFYKPAAEAGRARNFVEFEAFVNGLSRADYTKFTTASGCGAGMAPFFGEGTRRAIANARKVGAGAGISILESFGTLGVVALLVIASQFFVGGSS
jgi:hypothetical protein